MNRNTEAHFAQLPSANIGRSKFDRGFTHKTTFNCSELVPVYVDPDIVPGDTVTMRQSEIVRMMTPIAPVMDNAYLDFYWFFVPDRLVWDSFKEMMGENNSTPWTQEVEKTVPQLQFDSNGSGASNKCSRDIVKGSVLQHMGIPITNWTVAAEGTTNYKQKQISMLPTRAYALIWNEFFRDENLQNPVNVPKNDTTTRIKNQYHADYIADPEAAQVANAYLGGLPCLKVCKPHDYFTSALPGPQKGPAVKIPLSEDWAPVSFHEHYADTSTSGMTGYDKLTDFNKPAYIGKQSTTLGGGIILDTNPDLDETYTFDPVPPSSETGRTNIYSLATDLTQVTGATVNALRQAFAIQKFYERDARGGWAKAI